MQEICENIRTSIEHGRTDIIRSILDACTYKHNLYFIPYLFILFIFIFCKFFFKIIL